MTLGYIHSKCKVPICKRDYIVARFAFLKVSLLGCHYVPNILLLDVCIVLTLQSYFDFDYLKNESVTGCTESVTASCCCCCLPFNKLPKVM